MNLVALRPVPKRHHPGAIAPPLLEKEGISCASAFPSLDKEGGHVGAGWFDSSPAPAYPVAQVLVTPQTAAPRVVKAVFLCPTGFAPMGDGPDRKAGRTSVCVLLTSPTSALVSAAQVSNRSNRYV